MPASESLEILLKLRDQASAQLESFEKTIQDVEKASESANRDLDKTEKELTQMGKVAARTRSVLRRLAISGASALGKAFRGVRTIIQGTTRAIFSLRGAIVGLGAGLLARQFLQAAVTSEQFRTRLNILLGSVKEGSKLFASMAEFAGTVSFQYQEIMGAATNLSGVMKGGREEVEQYIPLIADIAAASGLGIQETTSNIIRMYSAGAAAADMFRERGVLSMLGFQAGVSVSAEETRKRLLAIMDDPTSNIKGAAEALSRTWSGMLSMLSDAWFQFRNLVMDAGVFDYIKAIVSTFLDYIKQLKSEGRLKEWAEEMADSVVKALEVVIRAVAAVSDAWWGWQMIWQALKIGFGTMAQYVTLGMSKIVDIVDIARGKIKELGGDAARVGKVLTYMPGAATKSLGIMLQQLEGSNAELGETGEKLREQSEWWKDVVKESREELDVLAAKESNWKRVSKFLDIVKKKAAEYRAELDKEGKGRPARPAPEVGLADKIKSELTRLKATTATALTELGILYANNKRSLDEYFNERRAILERNFEKEIGLLEKSKILVSPENPKKRLQIEDQIFARRQKHTQDSLKLTEERRKAELKAAADIRAIEASLGAARKRLLGEGTAGATEARFAEEAAAMDRRHAEELQSLRSHKADMAAEEELYRLQQLEKDKLAADQRQQILDMTLKGMQTSIGYLNEAFGDLYEASGQQAKEFFYLQKAAAIAQTVITTYQNAVLAYQQGLQIPYVGIYLAPIFAATAVAAGMAKVAAITAQSLAEGGMVEKRKSLFKQSGKVINLDDYRDGGKIKMSKTKFALQKLAGGGQVKGYSPTKTADNIQINATAGEFVHPVDVVKHYGERGMEAIRQKLIPREALVNFAATVNRPQSNYSYAYQTGGKVAGESGQQNKPPEGQAINVVNVVDPNMMDQYVSTTHGQKNILNVISQNSFAVKQILASE